MCKILCISGIEDQNREAFNSFIYGMSKQMSKHPNNDGLGYAAIDSEGNLFGERWHKNHEAFEKRSNITELDKQNLKKYKGFIRKEIHKDYNSFGKYNWDNIKSITFHTRLATSGKEFENTHPFVVGNTSLIHNGVVYNADEFELVQSTCDSEVILNLYLKHKVNENAENISLLAKEISAYYACGMFSRNNNKPILDIFKHNANLHAAFIKELNTMVFSTQLTDIEEVCQELGFTILESYECNPGVLLRLDALTGNFISSTTFEAPVGVRKDFNTIIEHHSNRNSWSSNNNQSKWYKGR